MIEPPGKNSATAIYGPSERNLSRIHSTFVISIQNRKSRLRFAASAAALSLIAAATPVSAQANGPNLKSAWKTEVPADSRRISVADMSGDSKPNLLVLGKEGSLSIFGLSGATPGEAVSWGKVDPDRLPDAVVCYVDSTVALPLITAYALTRH